MLPISPSAYIDVFPYSYAHSYIFLDATASAPSRPRGPSGEQSYWRVQPLLDELRMEESSVSGSRDDMGPRNGHIIRAIRRSPLITTPRVRRTERSVEGLGLATCVILSFAQQGAVASSHSPLPSGVPASVQLIKNQPVSRRRYHPLNLMWICTIEVPSLGTRVSTIKFMM